MDCLDENTVVEFAAGGLPAGRRAAVETHVDGCPDCRQLLIALAHGSPGPGAGPVEGDLGDDDEALGRGATVGRFIVIETLGAGASGVVYAAFDPELDRKVAIKLLRRELLELLPDARERLLREARALARLSHPGVVSVFEAGAFGDRVFLAMELVEGTTLRACLRARPHDWREVRDLFARAGRGLAAAHAAGVVHRDVKPDNILVGHDGRACVTDFGLARAAGPEPPREGEAAPPMLAEAPTQTAAAPLSLMTTRTGALIGTPAYMAPEQLAGDRADARSDQFGFCASLYEGFYGGRPFSGSTLAQLSAAIAAGPDLEPPPGRRVPTHVRRLLGRGLAADPERRFPSMDALLAELDRDPDRTRARRLASASAAVVVAGAVAWSLFGSRPDGDSAERLCRAAPERVAAAWGPDRRDRIERAFLATGRPHAAATFRRVAAELDGRTAEWAWVYTDTCEATHRRGEQSADMLDLRMACLDRRLTTLAALAHLFGAAPDGVVVDQAVQAVADLPGLEACSNVALLRGGEVPPRDPVIRARVTAARERVAAAEALGRAGKYEPGRVAATSAAAEARAAGWPPLLAEALLVRGNLEHAAGRHADAEQTLHEAAAIAAEARDDALLARIWTELLSLVGFTQTRHAEGDLLVRVATAAVARAGDHADEIEAALGMAHGDLLWSEGKYVAAEARYRQAIARVESTRGADDPALVELRRHLANVLDELGRLQPARAELERALALGERRLGAAHPDTARTRSLLGRVIALEGDYPTGRRLLDRALADLEEMLGQDHANVASTLQRIGIAASDAGDFAGGQAALERGLAILERVHGPEHANVASAHDVLGTILVDRGDLESARRHHELAMAIRVRTLGADHAEVVVSRLNLGRLLYAAGQQREARQALEEALAHALRVLGPEHHEVAVAHANLASVLADAGEQRAALEHYRRALAVYEKLRGPDHPDTAAVLTNTATVLMSLGDAEQARADLERALAIQTQALGAGHLDVAYTHHALSQLHALRKDFDAAAEHARAAAAIMEKHLGPDHPQTAIARTGLAAVALRAGRTEEAAALAEEVVRALEAAGQAGDRQLAAALVLAARTHLAGDRPERAAERAARALAIYEQGEPVDPVRVADAEYALARGLWSGGNGRERALGLARRALGRYRGAGAATDAAEVRAWLAAR